MMGKIDKITKISGVQLDANSPWLQRRHRDDQGSEDSFKDMLRERAAKGVRSSAAAAPGEEAAVWEGNGATQSLFYEKGVDLDFFYRQRLGDM